MNEALSKTEDMRRALTEISRVLRRSGRVLILDWVTPVARQNTASTNTAMPENHLRALLAEQGMAVVFRSWLPGKSPDYALFVVERSDGLKAASA